MHATICYISFFYHTGWAVNRMNKNANCGQIDESLLGFPISIIEFETYRFEWAILVYVPFILSCVFLER